MISVTYQMLLGEQRKRFRDLIIVMILLPTASLENFVNYACLILQEPLEQRIRDVRRLSHHGWDPLTHQRLWGCQAHVLHYK